MLKPQLQTELTVFLFQDTVIEKFGTFFGGCDQMFINRIVVSLSYKAFMHNKLVQSPNELGNDVYFIKSGGVAICETTSYLEPILVYPKGSVINLYQVFMNEPL